MNCEHLTVVVRADTYRLVSYCEHGTIQINWDLATLRLRPANFERLTDLLKQVKAAPDPARVGRKQYFGLIRQENGGCQLWAGDVALFFGPTDFLLFADLLLNARQRLGKQLPQPSAKTLLREHQPGERTSGCFRSRN